MMWSELLAKLRVISLYYQTSHWSVKTSLFYADHLLFERLYNTVNDEIDGVAERAVGVSGIEAVNLVDCLSRMLELSSQLPYEATQNSAYVQAALLLEQELLIFLSATDKDASLTLGTKNMLQNLADKHEANVYLLKQRLSQ